MAFLATLPSAVPCLVTPEEAGRCQTYAPALALLIFLRQNSGPLPFPIVPETVGPRLCMSPARVRAARAFLLRTKLILPAEPPHRPHQGSKGRHPRLFHLPLQCQPAAQCISFNLWRK